MRYQRMRDPRYIHMIPILNPDALGLMQHATSIHSLTHHSPDTLYNKGITIRIESRPAGGTCAHSESNKTMFLRSTQRGLGGLSVSI